MLDIKKTHILLLPSGKPTTESPFGGSRPKRGNIMQLIHTSDPSTCTVGLSIDFYVDEIDLTIQVPCFIDFDLDGCECKLDTIKFPGFSGPAATRLEIEMRAKKSQLERQAVVLMKDFHTFG